MMKITLSAGLCLAFSLAAAASVGDADGYSGARNMPAEARIEASEVGTDGYSGTQNMPAEARIEASEGDTNGYSDAQNMPGKAKVEVFECDTDGVLRCPETDIPAISEASKRRAAELVSRMTLEEKLSYIGGVDGFYIREIPRLGIPRIRMADGPQGVRNDTKSTMQHIPGFILDQDLPIHKIHINNCTRMLPVHVCHAQGKGFRRFFPRSRQKTPA